MSQGRQAGATALEKVTGWARVRMEKSYWVVLSSYSGSLVIELRLARVRVPIRASNKGSRRFNNNKDGPDYGLLRVEST